MHDERPTQLSDLPEPDERPESESLPDERPWTVILGLPSLILLLALVAVIEGIADQNLGFAIVGAVVAVGVLFAIGYSMIVANRE
jgi:hypothetical protein